MPSMRGASSSARNPVADRSAVVSEQEKSMTNASDRVKRIAALNDKFRAGMASGRVHLTAGVNERGGAFVTRALVRVMTFDDFNAGNDTHGERDFGSFELEDEKLFWKIDYFDPKGEFGSEDPSDPKRTLRVLTVMMAEEY
jgi:hypothetical protein